MRHNEHVLLKGFFLCTLSTWWSLDWIIYSTVITSIVTGYDFGSNQSIHHAIKHERWGLSSWWTRAHHNSMTHESCACFILLHLVLWTSCRACLCLVISRSHDHEMSVVFTCATNLITMYIYCLFWCFAFKLYFRVCFFSIHDRTICFKVPDFWFPVPPLYLKDTTKPIFSESMKTSLTICRFEQDLCTGVV